MDPIDTVTTQAAEALDAFANGAAQEAADNLADVFEAAGDRIAASLEQAAQTGKLSFNDLAESILNDFARLAVSELITAPLEGLVSSITGSIASGSAAAKSSPVTVNLNMNSGNQKLSGPQASSAQIASQVARAVTQVQSRN